MCNDILHHPVLTGPTAAPCGVWCHLLQLLCSAVVVVHLLLEGGVLLLQELSHRPQISLAVLQSGVEWRGVVGEGNPSTTASEDHSQNSLC